MHLRAARPDELAELSALCLRSKAVWGYDGAFLDACRAELTLSAADIVETEVRVAEHAGTLLGVAQVSREATIAYLEKLFVEPSTLRAGTGRALFEWAVEAARKAGATELIVESDPGAVPFYLAMGAHAAGRAPSGSIPGRTLPRLRVGFLSRPGVTR